MTIHDVLIVGAGPAGSALAIELCRHGHDVLLIDSAKFPRDKICGDFVSPKGLHLLEELGCGPEIRALSCTPIRRSRLYLNSERLVTGELPEVPGLPSHGLAIPRLKLDHILFSKAVAAGAKTSESTRISGLERDPTGVEVRGTKQGKPFFAKGRVLVGADGATSIIARLAGQHDKDPRHTLASIRAYAHGIALDHTLMYFDEQFFPGYGWVFPVRPGLCNIGVGMVTEPLVKHGLRLPDFYQKFERFVRHLARSQGVNVTLDAARGWPIHSFGAPQSNVFERGLLIGEAGGFVDPINGEGIPLALESAKIAARTLRLALSTGQFSALDLKRYESDWRAHFEADLDLSDLVVSMIRNRHLLPLWLTLFRTMSLTANEDPKYAAVTGGILGGVVPARNGVTPEMFLRAMVHGPDFWMRALQLDPTSPVQWLRRGADALRFQVDLTKAILSDGPWFRAWAKEVENKQRKVAVRTVKGSLPGFEKLKRILDVAMA
jgi:geranylgeranyl reductase family protein